jgi:pyruvate, orthophosphate dikinase
VTAWTLFFDQADPADVDLLGGKGAGLARLVRLGLPVPPGYVISTRACRQYLVAGISPDGLFDEVETRLVELEARTGKTFGGGSLPLLVSVRSGAPVSMPGMMDTILDLGLCQESALALTRLTGSTAFMADVVLRFHRMYAETVLGALDVHEDAARLAAKVGPDDPADEVFAKLWQTADQAVVDDVGSTVPQDPRAQLRGAVEAVFDSWNTRRARTYRDHHGIAHDLGTAVVIQSMVFGNLGADSGSGVVFTRDPATGEPAVYGEYLANSQGEDVVAGTRTPDRLPGMMPAAAWTELTGLCLQLERELGDVLDIEFTVEQSRLYLLQVRKAKRTPQAAVRIAADLLAEGVVDVSQALGAVMLEHVRQIQRPGFDQRQVGAARDRGDLLATGTGACPGQVSGMLALTSAQAKAMAEAGVEVVLARPVTSPTDLEGMIAAQGILTATGGATSHAAVVARALGTACVVGVRDLLVDVSAGSISVGDRTLAEGTPVSLDGSTGEVFIGAFAREVAPNAGGALEGLLAAAVREAGCAVYARVTLPGQVDGARRHGAQGLVTGADDLLTASGRLEPWVHRLLQFGQVTADVCAELEQALDEELEPLLAAARGLQVGVRAIDVLADESRELMQQTALLTRLPELSMPVGAPDLIEAQLAAVSRAAARTGTRVHLSVRHVRDPAEMAELRAVRERVAARLADSGEPVPAVPVGAYLTSPRAVAHLAGTVSAAELAWLELRTLQARVFGIPARQLLTAQPLDDYLRRGLLAQDPRTSLDPVLEQLLAGALAQAPRTRADDDAPAPAIGVRLSGQVATGSVAALHRLGIRRFAVESGEVRPLLLALGQAATTAAARS